MVLGPSYMTAAVIVFTSLVTRDKKCIYFEGVYCNDDIMPCKPASAAQPDIADILIFAHQLGSGAWEREIPWHRYHCSCKQ